MSIDMFNNDLTVADSFGTPRTANSQPTVRPTWTNDGADKSYIYMGEFCVAQAFGSTSVAAEVSDRIVKCVNTYDVLLAALKECMKDAFTASNGMSEGGDRFAKARYRQALDALALAGE